MASGLGAVKLAPSITVLNLFVKCSVRDNSGGRITFSSDNIHIDLAFAGRAKQFRIAYILVSVNLLQMLLPAAYRAYEITVFDLEFFHFMPRFLSELHCLLQQI